MNEDIVKGKTKQVVGTVKEKVGAATHNPARQAAGVVEKISGKAQVAVGKAKDQIKSNSKKAEKTY